MNKTAAVVLLGIYSFIVALGGVIGYVKADSIPSLVMGLAFGLALLFNTFGVAKGCVMALKISIGLTAFLGIFFLYRYLLSYAFMPAGLMTLLSAVMLVILLLLAYSHRK